MYKNCCNAVSCYDLECKQFLYIYPTVAPVLRMAILRGYVIFTKNMYYDIIAFSDAAGFLTVSVGGTEEN